MNFPSPPVDRFPISTGVHGRGPSALGGKDEIETKRTIAFDALREAGIPEPSEYEGDRPGHPLNRGAPVSAPKPEPTVPGRQERVGTEALAYQQGARAINVDQCPSYPPGSPFHQAWHRGFTEAHHPNKEGST